MFFLIWRWLKPAAIVVFICSVLGYADFIQAPGYAPSGRVLGDIVSVSAQSPDQNQTTSLSYNTAQDLPNDIQAHAGMVYSLSTGQVFYQRRTDQAVPVASLTKLMTAVVSVRYFGWDDVITVPALPEEAHTKPNLGVRFGQKISVGDLVRAMMVGSANDAAATLALVTEQKTSAYFPDLMNQMAQLLDLKSTHFANPYGFDSAQNYASCEDVAKLIWALNYRLAIRSWGQDTSYSTTSGDANLTIRATNKLIGQDKHVWAVKTGQTSEAGGAMVVLYEHPKYGDVVSIIIGSSNRERDTKKMLQLIQNLPE